jgi:hypothetical protein
LLVHVGLVMTLLVLYALRADSQVGGSGGRAGGALDAGDLGDRRAGRGHDRLDGQSGATQSARERAGGGSGDGPGAWLSACGQERSGRFGAVNVSLPKVARGSSAPARRGTCVRRLVAAAAVVVLAVVIATHLLVLLRVAGQVSCRRLGRSGGGPLRERRTGRVMRTSGSASGVPRAPSPGSGQP